MKTISFMIQKGGTGKTTTCLNTAHCLAALGYKVLLIDADRQGTLTDLLRADPHHSCLTDLLSGADPENVIQAAESVSVIASDPRKINSTGTEMKRLRTALKRVSGYDFILIDCPPALTADSIEMLRASDGVIIPVRAESLSVKSTLQVLGTIKAIQERNDSKPEVLGIVITQWNGRTVLAKQSAEMLQRIAASNNTAVFNTHIRNNIAIQEAQALGKNLLLYAPRSNGAQDYKSLTAEILGRL